MQRQMVNCMRVGIVFVLVFVFSLLTLGCGTSKEEQAKQDVEGKKINDAGMQRMMQDQGAPQAAGPGTQAPGGAPAPGGSPAPSETPAPGGVRAPGG